MGQNKSSFRAPSTQQIATDSSSRGVHLFEVANYSQHRNLGVRSFIRSSTFHVGGCAWSVRFYPDGENTRAENEGYVAVGVQLMTQDAVVAASYDMGLIDRATGARYSRVEGCKIDFDTRSSAEDFVQCRISSQFVKKSELEASTYLRDDRLVIECTLRVIKGSRLVSEVMVEREIDVPQSDLPDHLGSMLKEGIGTDVTFDVQGKSFPAHRMLLAARSPVFKAELLGPMEEGSADRIAVHEIQPEVFDALLHFAYTDSLPSMDDDNKGDEVNLIGDLLVAADRYAMDRLKLVCERKLSRSLTVENVSTVLVLASRHNCSRLKDACIEFMMSNTMDDVTRTHGYARLKRDHPHVLIDFFEKKPVKLRKIAS